MFIRENKNKSTIKFKVSDNPEENIGNIASVSKKVLQSKDEFSNRKTGLRAQIH